MSLRRALPLPLSVSGLLLALLLASGSAAAATRHAAPRGDGPAGKCPRSNPCNLADAVGDASVAPGDVVVLRKGTYRVRAGITVSERIRVRGPRQGKPAKLVGKGETVLAVGGGATVSDLQVVKGGEGGRAALVTQGVLERVKVTAKRSFACELAGGAADQAAIRNGVCAAPGAGTALLLAIAGPGQRFGTAQGVTLWAGKEAAAAIAAGATGGGEGTLEVRNAIAVGGNVADVVSSTDGLVGSRAEVRLGGSSYRTVHETEPGAVTAPGEGSNITERPRLAKPAAGNFRQRPGSPTINAGVKLSKPGKLDFEGSPRVQGKGQDIGADESSNPRRLLKLLGRRIRPADTLKVKARCPIAPCSVSGKATVFALGGKRTFKIVPTSARQGRTFRLRVPLGKGAGDLARAIAPFKVRIKAQVTDRAGFKGRKRKTYTVR